MAKSKNFTSRREAETNPAFFDEHPAPSFLIRKASVELKVMPDQSNASVKVAHCRTAKKPLAESVARTQQQLLRMTLQNHTGENLCAYLLSLYTAQGWAIGEMEEKVFAKNEKSKRASQTKK